MTSQDDGWMDGDVGPVARPYMVTAGRTRPRGEAYFDLLDVVVAARAEPSRAFTTGPELGRILDLCQRPIAVADLAGGVGLPLSLVRVLLADLAYEGLINTVKKAPAGRVTDPRLLQKVLDGLHAL